MLDFLRRANSIYLFGAGKTAIQIIDYLASEGIKIESLIVSNKELCAGKVRNLPVIDIDEYEHIKGNCIVICVKLDSQDEIKKLLVSKFGDRIQSDLYEQRYVRTKPSTTAKNWYDGVKSTGVFLKVIIY